MITLHDVLSINNRSARKFWAMGFALDRAEIQVMDDSAVISGNFTCTCGRHEMFRQILPVYDYHYLADAYKDQANAYIFLDRYGSMGRQHLLDDGYSLETVEEMLKRGQDVEFGQAMAHLALTSMVIEGNVARMNGDWKGTYERALQHRAPIRVLSCYYDTLAVYQKH